MGKSVFDSWARILSYESDMISHNPEFPCLLEKNVPFT